MNKKHKIILQKRLCGLPNYRNTVFQITLPKKIVLENGWEKGDELSISKYGSGILIKGES